MGATKTTNPVHDVLIVGAGPVGLALALDLGQRGVRALVVERKPGTGTQIEAKASVLNERTMEYCRRLGVRDDVANAGYPQDLPGDTVYCTALHDRFIGRLEMPSYVERDLPPESSEMLQRCPQWLLDKPATPAWPTSATPSALGRARTPAACRTSQLCQSSWVPSQSPAMQR